jgi:acetyltransferase-like isoleucine patch superfamily enzyme
MIKIHPLADNQSHSIGADTRIWQFSVIMEGAVIGKNCNICAHTLIESDVIIGDHVTVKSGVYLWDGTRIGHHVFIGPNATFTNDRYPRSKQYPEQYLGITVEDGASIGANATLLPGITIGAYALIGAGAVVTKDVPAYTLVAGNPGRIVRRIQK